MTFRRRGLILGAAAVAIAGVVIGTAVSQSNPMTTTTCSASPAASISATPPGGTWRGAGCFLVPGGLQITEPITIEPLVGRTLSFTDPTSALSHTHSGGLAPIVSVVDTTDVTISDVSVTGANTKGTYQAPLVNGAGFWIGSSSNVTLSHDSATDTFGDGVEIVQNLNPGHPKNDGPSTDITVDHLKTSASGRDAFNPIEVTDSQFSNLTLGSSARPSIDMESDEPGLGSGNLTFTDVNARHAFNANVPLSGPLTFIGYHSNDYFHIKGGGKATVTFTDGSFTCQRAAPITCVTMTGGVLTITGSTFSRTAGTSKLTEPYYVTTSPPGVVVAS